MGECELRRANDDPGRPCEERECIYWRVVDHVGLPDVPREGCAIQYFHLLGEDGREIAEWLLSVKERIEGTTSG